jgi:polyisoprenoid-binding protein YceI
VRNFRSSADEHAQTSGPEHGDRHSPRPFRCARLSYTGEGPATARVPAFARLMYFAGPRTPEIAAAADRAGPERIWPAISGLNGLVGVYVLSGSDLGAVIITLAISVETLDAAARATLSTDMTHPAMTSAVSPVRPGDWAADPAASTLTFAVPNFGLRTVTGQIPLTSAVVHVGPGGQPEQVRAELDPGGIDTGNRHRDKDMRGRRFLATGRWPAIIFEAGHIQPDETGWTVSGTLTVKDAHCPGTAPGHQPGHLSRRGAR